MTAERPRYYVDTSAWLAGLLGDVGGEAIARELRGAELLSSVLLVVEVHRNLVRLARDGRMSAEQLQQALDHFERDLQTFDLQELTFDLASDRTMPVVTTPRSLDLIHLRTALRYHHERPLTRFVSLDDALNRGARELGLPV